MTYINRTVMALFLAIFFVLTPSFARAQVSEPVTSLELKAQIDALNQSLIALLTQMIADLQAQITVLIAQQSQTSKAVATLGTQVETVQAQTAPVLGGVPTITQPVVYSAEFEDMQSYFTALRNRDNPALDQNFWKTRTTIRSNKPIDYSKTEIWINGEKKNVSFELRHANINGAGQHETQFFINPSVYSFMEEGVEYGSPFKKLRPVTMKIVMQDGEVLTSNFSSTLTVTGPATLTGNLVEPKFDQFRLE